MPPYCASERMRGGIRRPKETAIMRDIFGVGGIQLVKVSMGWVGRCRDVAWLWIGTIHHSG
jgi:hypothetical protein